MAHRANRTTVSHFANLAYLAFKVGIVGTVALCACGPSGGSGDHFTRGTGGSSATGGAASGGRPGTGGADTASSGGAGGVGAGMPGGGGAAGRSVVGSGGSAGGGAANTGGASSGGTAPAGGGNSGGAGTGGTTGAGGTAPRGKAAWNAPQNGNPFVPGYFADPSIFFDQDAQTFYLFATTDGVWISYSAEPMAWSSTDFVRWKGHPLSLPASWPKSQLWAPSVMKHPSNGLYYLIYAAGGQGTFIAQATSPLGPWKNATTGTGPLYAQGSMWGSSDGFDAQFFVDGDTVYMTFGGGGLCGIARLSFAADGTASIDNTDARMTDGNAHKFKKLSGLGGYLEGSVMFKNGNQYFLAYSNSACQNYNVQYAVGSSPLGPFTHGSGTILQRDNGKNVLGPGHNSVFKYGEDWYIVYHRQHYPYVDVKRQTCVDHIVINGSTVSTAVQTQEGIVGGSGSLESFAAQKRAAAAPDLAFGKTVLASGESSYKGGTSGNITETFPAVSGAYAGRYAVDHNYGTRWAPTMLPGSLIIDLGADVSIGRCETTFEYPTRAYRYRIESLTQADAASISTAQTSTAWQMYADRSKNTDNISPVLDAAPATARYLRLTLLSADLPTARDEIRTIVETDYADRVSVSEFSVYAGAK
ncbi:MAG: family 43 glycosylhydrolase [Polyangia bacterium]